MPVLVSPGSSITITDQSFYVPVAAPTVPLFFVASRANKTQPGSGSLPAEGTNEHSVVRLVTSIAQSLEFYGVPYFRVADGDEVLAVGSRRQQHGDCRNEYGLFALNQFLGVANQAYVVRANIDLNDEVYEFVSDTPEFEGVGATASLTTGEAATAARITGTSFTGFDFSSSNASFDIVLSGAATGNGTASITLTTNITSINDLVTAVSADIGSLPVTISSSGGFLRITANVSEESTITVNNFAGAGIASIPGVLGMTTGETDSGTDSTVTAGVTVNQTDAVEETWTIKLTSGTTWSVVGSVSGAKANATTGTLYNNGQISFTINAAGTTPYAVNDEFTVFVDRQIADSTLGSTDAIRRAAIVAALDGEIASNTEVRAENAEYNLILCPGYPETVTSLRALQDDIGGEAFIIGDVPMNIGASAAVTWMGTDAASGNGLSYYYPHALATNLDGAKVVVPSSGVALRTFAFSDSNANIWEAPAGAQRGVVSGVDKIGYVSGTLGSVTTFVELNPNQGQRDAMYQGLTALNPIARFPGRGIMVFGQKTRATASSALDRINVSRLLMYIKRQLRKGSFPFIFEINDKITRENLKAMIDGFLQDILIKRGLYDYVTVCDESNNLSTNIDRNELIATVAIQPAKVAEFIYIPITVQSTGT